MKELKQKFKKEIQIKIDEIQIKIDEIGNDLSKESGMLFNKIWELQEFKDKI
jgi:hypothetical protein